MTRNIDELSNLTTQKAEPPKQYFAKMDLNEEQVEKRLQYTEKANELFDVILILLLTMNERGDTNFFSIRNLLESWILSLVAEFTTPDDYLIDYAADTAYNFVDTTNRHIDDPWYTSSDRALYNAENGANDVLNYSEYKEAIESGKTEKRWITEKDNRVRKSHKAVIKKPIPILEYFQVGMARMRFPKDYEMADAFPEELVNCRCTIEYLRKNEEKVEKVAESKQNRIENNVESDIIKSYYFVPYSWKDEEGTAKYNPDSKKYEAVVANRKVTDFMLKPETKHYNEFIGVGYDADKLERLLEDLLLNFDLNKRIEVEYLDNNITEWAQIMELGIAKKKRFRTAWRIDHRFDGIPRLLSAYRENLK